MDKLTCRREKEFRFGEVARAINEQKDLFAVVADPLTFSDRRLRFPSGPAVILPDMPLVPHRYGEEDECERWDGLA